MSFAATALRLASGVIVWALHFAAVYGFTALACARGWSAAVAPAIATATALAALAALAIVVAGMRKRTEFDSWLMAGIAALSLVAILWEAIAVLLVPACG